MTNTVTIPIVSVKMITYMHENFIRQAIEGVLIQETKFDFELIIADDCSPDKTPEIVNEIISTHSKGYRIKYFRQKENLGMNSNGIFALSKCIGKYIALCEGDDYWTDPYKLQKQVIFLETNSHIAGCFHDVINVDEYGRMTKENYYESPQKIYNQYDCLALGGAYATCSLLFRTLVIQNPPAWFLKATCDYTIDLLITEFGDIAHLDENMGAYRIHRGGLWQGNKEHKNLEEIVFRFRTCLTNPKFKKKYKSFYYNKINELSASIALYYLKEKKYFKKIKYAWFYFYYLESKDLCSCKFIIKTLLFPNLYRKLSFLFTKL